MREPKYKVGNVVFLKSGSPDMTVMAIGRKITPQNVDGEFSGKYKCTWFDGVKNYDGEFPEETLELSGKDADYEKG